MRNKVTLSLIEQAIMLLTFALCAVLCLRAFAWSDSRSELNAARDAGILCAQNAAETLKSCSGSFEKAGAIYGGSWDGERWIIEDGDITVTVTPAHSGLELLGKATVTAMRGDEILAEFDVCWQEVAGHE